MNFGGRRRPSDATIRGLIVLVSAATLTAAAPPGTAASSTINAAADAYVDASAPKQRFGGATELVVSGAPTRTAYLRFDLTRITEPIARATLVLRATTSATSGVQVRSVTDSTWNERNITYQNAPALGPAVLGAAGAFDAGERRIDLSGIAPGRQTTIAITTSAATPVRFASREQGAVGPKLELEIADAGAPAVTLTTPTSGSTTNRSQPVFAGAAGTATGDLPDVTVRVYSGALTEGTPVQTLSTTANAGAWSVTASASLSDGAYTAQASQVDDTGNVGRSATSTFTIDTVAPAPAITSPSAASTVTSTPSFAGTAGTAPGDAAAVTVRLYAGASATGAESQVLHASVTGGNWSATAATLADGTYTARAEQTDAASNVGVSAPVTFTVEASAPPPPPPPPPTDYRSIVLGDAPRGYWRLGESAGTVAADETASGLAGTYVNGVALGRPGAISGDSNTAVSLDGSNDTIRIPNHSALATGAALSVEAYIRPAALPSTSATIARKESQYLLRLTSSGAITFRLWKGGGIAETSTAGGTIPVGAWSHLAATWDGATMRVYVNAVQRASRALAAPVDVSSQDLHLGSSYNSYDRYAGSMDEVAVYAAALPADRITARVQAAGSGGASPAPSVRLMTPTDGTTMESTPNFGGHATAGAGVVTVRIYAGAAPTGTPVQSPAAAVQPAGTFSVRASPLASGTYTAVAEQADGAGNVGRSAAVTFGVDATLHPSIVGAGDIAGCDTPGDEATAAVLDQLAGTVLTLGDHVYERATVSDFTNCYDPTWGRHRARTRPTVGDHEYLTTGAVPYFDYFGSAAGDPSKGYYSFDLGSWHVVSLNAVCAEVGGCHAGSPQEQWLRADLAANRAECTVAILHKPRFSSGAVHGSNTSFQPFWQALYDHNADLVLSGNEHLYERFAPQTPSGVADPVRGIRQITVGTGGRSLYQFGTILPNSEVRGNDALGVVKVTLRPGAYDWRFVPEAGKTFTDSGTTACH